MTQGEELPRPRSTPDFAQAATSYLESAFPSSEPTPMQSGMLLLMLANIFQNDCEQRVHRPMGLGWTGYSILFTLAAFGQQHAGYLARVAGVSRQAISRAISALERDGLITRTGGEDRRTQKITLTDAGRKVSHQATDGQIGLSEEWFEDLDSDEQRQFLESLQKVLNASARRRAEARLAGS